MQNIIQIATIAYVCIAFAFFAYPYESFKFYANICKSYANICKRMQNFCIHCIQFLHKFYAKIYRCLHTPCIWGVYICKSYAMNANVCNYMQKLNVCIRFKCLHNFCIRFLCKHMQKLFMQTYANYMQNTISCMQRMQKYFCINFK